MQPRCNTLATPVLLPSTAAMRKEITCEKIGSKSYFFFVEAKKKNKKIKRVAYSDVFFFCPVFTS